MLHFNVLSEGFVFVKLQFKEYTGPGVDRVEALNMFDKNEQAHEFVNPQPKTAEYAPLAVVKAPPANEPFPQALLFLPLKIAEQVPSAVLH